MSSLPRTEAYLASKAAAVAPRQRKGSVWADITRDHTTGHTVAKDLFKAWAFSLGCFYLVGLVPTSKLVFHQDLTVAPGFFLLGLAFGVQALKEGSNYFNRKTADEAGNPLMQAGTELAPSTPNVPVP